MNNCKFNQLNKEKDLIIGEFPCPCGCKIKNLSLDIWIERMELCLDFWEESILGKKTTLN